MGRRIWLSSGRAAPMVPRMSLVSPRYQSLPDQVTARIVGEMEKGTWVKLLPGERVLIDYLNVSRKTLRKALGQLKKEGVIKTERGIGHRIVRTARREARPSISIGLLVPDSIEKLRHFTALWVDDLRALLFENNIRLVTFSSRRFYTLHPDKALARLTRQNPQACWVLSYTNEAIQQWFHHQRIPCIVAGTCHAGISIPNVHMDYRATSRHAVGAMLSRGHRRLGYLARKSRNAGDLEGEIGFAEGVERAARAGVQSIVMRHDGSVDGIARELARALASGAAPTAILVNDPVFYLTAASFLAERGLRVGKDVSLLSIDDDRFLPYLIPQPARYVCNFRSFAKELFALVLQWVRGEQFARTTSRVEASFVAGSSLAPWRGPPAGHPGRPPQSI